jgi:2-polyprenyl-3-methyl-5-hydroxy-6-metoxy-1,4-benzoquinol methylase
VIPPAGLHPVLARAVEGLPARARFHIRGRARSFPLFALSRQVPEQGRILEVGCGHGLVAATLALESPGRELVGFDIDRDKIELARVLAAAVEAAGGNLTVSVGDGRIRPEGLWDAVIVADVLYLLAPPDQAQLVEDAARALRPGGVLVVKELDVRPRAKFAFARLEELVATRVLRVTAGDALHWRPAARWAELIEGAGLTAAVHRVDRGYPYPHVLITGHRDHQATNTQNGRMNPQP